MSRPSSLDFRGDPVAHDRFDDLEEDEEQREDPDDAGDRADCLRGELRRVAVEQALDRAGHAVPAVAIGAVGEQADRQHAERAADAVHRDRADRIVDLQHAVDEEHRLDDQHAGDGADDDRRHAVDERARRGDRHQPGEQAVARACSGSGLPSRFHT